MVTLRSQAKHRAVSEDTSKAPAQSNPASLTAVRSSRRSVSPDQSSQNSGLRRSQRMVNRRGALESIQEDTAASAEVKADTAAASQPVAPLLADTASETAHMPSTLSTAAAVPAAAPTQTALDVSLQASAATRYDGVTAAAEASEGDSDSEAEADMLAQLSQNMWAALRPEMQQPANTSTAQHTADVDAAEPDSLAGFQPKDLQPADVEEDLHWQPETGLPNPLDAKTCSSARAAPRHAHLEKQFKLLPRDTRSMERQAQKLAPQTAGRQWFDLPAQQLTDETRRDLKLLQLRGTFDPKRFYKSSDHKKGLPKFFQIGTVVESAADFYSGRLSNKERKRTITEELLSDPELSQARKRRFDKLQDERAYWAKKKGRKTELPRGKKTTRTRK